MISANLQKMIGEAMKARDQVRLATLRLLSSAFNYEKIEKQRDLTEEEEIAIIRKQVKQRKDSIESYTKAGSTDRAQAEQAEINILQEFLPPEMSVEELNKIIDEAVDELSASSMADMGKVIGLVKSKAPNADGAAIATLVKQKLS